MGLNEMKNMLRCADQVYGAFIWLTFYPCLEVVGLEVKE